jgi:hypothetical protein
MSDEQRPGQHEEAGDEVEGHKHHFAGNDEAEKDDEVEGHKHHFAGNDEAESDDEVEAHSKHRLAKHRLQ